MHVLIIPSEEYIPKSNPTAGIFQHDHAKIIQQKGNNVGALSFTFKYSFFTLIKAFFWKKNRYTKQLSSFAILQLLAVKLVCPKRLALTYELIDQVNVMRCDGFWGVKSSFSEIDKYNLWLEYGKYALNKYIKKYGKPDIIHAHNMVYAGLFALETKEVFNIPVVVTEHSSQYAMKGVSEEVEKLLKNAFNNHDHFYAVSPKLIDLLSQKFSLPKKKLQWLPNVLPPEIEKLELPKSLKKQDKFRFINIANLIPLKGQKELIEAFDMAFKRNEDVELVIAGQGFLHDELNNLIEKRNLKGKVKLIGLITRKEVVHQLDNSHVLVLPSHYETFGVVLIEALSRGIPVISTYCGGPECIVKEKNGVLIEPQNVKQLSQALRDIYINHNNYDRLAIREEVLNSFGGNYFYSKLLCIYNNAFN
ncbi:MAG: glycosyltransferase [Vicingus serpentipes]|nr:glycosyltransferase [Vicingus serpentipes]